MNMRLGLRLNTKINAVSQYAMPLNSLTSRNGIFYGGSEGGLVSIEGDQDNQSPIHSRVELVTTDMGSKNYKRIRWLQFGYESEGPLLLTVTANEGMSESYLLPAIVDDKSQSGTTVPISRNIVGRYFMITITNPNGVHFSLDSITGSIVFLSQRPRGG